MTPRQRLFVNGVLGSSISMPVFAIHNRESSPPVVNVEAILEQMTMAEMDEKSPTRTIVNRAR